MPFFQRTLRDPQQLQGNMGGTHIRITERITETYLPDSTTAVDHGRIGSMSRSTTAAKWALPAIGSALVIALQTPPEVASSNAAKWISAATGYLPDWPSWADTLGTIVGAALILLGLGIWIWDRRRKNAAKIAAPEKPTRIIYVAMNREPLPATFAGTGLIPIFRVVPVGDEYGEHSDIGWAVARVRCGSPPFDWHEDDPHPMAMRLVITNLSDETLISLRLVVTFKVSRPIPDHPHGLHETFAEKDQVLSLDRLRAGEDHPTTAYILNETPWTLDMYVKSAAAAGLHDEQVSNIGVRTDAVPSVIMFLSPAKRYRDAPRAAE